MPNSGENQKPERSQINDMTSVPLRWIFAICSVIITYAIYTAKTDVAGIRDEIKSMGINVSALNGSVSTLLMERDYMKRDIEALKLEAGKSRELIWELQQQRRKLTQSR